MDELSDHSVILHCVSSWLRSAYWSAILIFRGFPFGDDRYYECLLDLPKEIRGLFRPTIRYVHDRRARSSIGCVGRCRVRFVSAKLNKYDRAHRGSGRLSQALGTRVSLSDDEKQADVLHQDVVKTLMQPRFLGVRVFLVGFVVAGTGFLVAYLGLFSLGYCVLVLGWLIGAVGIGMQWVKALRK